MQYERSLAAVISVMMYTTTASAHWQTLKLASLGAHTLKVGTSYW
jgi:hypothetical protein